MQSTAGKAFVEDLDKLKSFFCEHYRGSAHGKEVAESCANANPLGWCKSKRTASIALSLVIANWRNGVMVFALTLKR